MGQQQTNQRTDTPSADVKALREQVDKFSDKLTDSQRDVAVLRAELGGQDKQLSRVADRINDLGIELAAFGIVLTVVLALAGFFGFVQAVRRAKAEAQDWIEQNSSKLQARVAAMEAEAANIKDRMNGHAQTVEADAAKHKASMAREVEALSKQMQEGLAGSVDTSKPLDPAQREELRRAEHGVKDKPENSYTADDWNIRAFAAYKDGKLSEAVLHFDRLAKSPDASPEKIATALNNKGVLLGQLARWPDAVATYQEVVDRFGAWSEASLREQVAIAWVNKGWSLDQAGRWEEAIISCDEVILHYGVFTEPALRERVAIALVNKGWSLGRVGRFEEAIATCDELVAGFATSEEPSIQKLLARGLVNKGWQQESNERREDAIATYSDVIDRFGLSEEQELQELVARALGNKGKCFAMQGRREEAIASYNDLLNRVVHSADLALQKMAARAFLHKVALLDELERWDEADASYDEMMRLFDEALDPEVREQVGLAIGNRGWRHYGWGEDSRFFEDTQRGVMRCPKLGVLLCNLAFALYLTGRSSQEVMEAYDQAWQVVKVAQEWEKLALTDLRNHGHSVRPDAEPVPQNLIDAVAALAKDEGLKS